MKFIPPFGIILFLIGATSLLQAIPWIEREELEQQVAERSNLENERSVDLADENIATLESHSMDNSINTSLAGDVIVPETSSPRISEQGETASTGSLQGVPVAAAQSTPHYRHKNGRWEELNDDTKKWEATDRFDLSNAESPSTFKQVTSEKEMANTANTNVLQMLFMNLNRGDGIEKRVKAYRQELEKLEQVKDAPIKTQHRIFALKHLVPILEKEMSYQNERMRHVLKQRLLPVEKMTEFTAINDQPQEGERIANRIEYDYQKLTEFQMISDVVQERIAGMPSHHQIPDRLQNTRKAIDEALEHQRTLIEQKAAYAQCLPPPFKEIDPPTQARIEEYALNCRKEENLINKKIKLCLEEMGGGQDARGKVYSQYKLRIEGQLEIEKKQPRPRTRVINLLTCAADLYQQAADNQQMSSLYTADTANLYYEAAQEAQQPQPREEVISLFTRLVELNQQINVSLANHTLDIESSCSAYAALFLAVQEAQKNQPRKEAISLLARSAELYQQAAAARANHTQGSEDLLSAGAAFRGAAEEAQKDQPQERVISFFTNAAALKQQAATSVNNKASNLRLSSAGTFFEEAAKEAQKDQPRERVISFFTNAAELKQQAATSANNKVSNLRLNSAGTFFEEAAKEAQKNQPRERIIKWLTRAVELYQQAAVCSAHGLPGGEDLHNAGHALYKAVQEARHPQPQEEKIKRFLKEAAELEKSGNEAPSSSCTIS